MLGCAIDRIFHEKSCQERRRLSPRGMQPASHAANCPALDASIKKRRVRSCNFEGGREKERKGKEKRKKREGTSLARFTFDFKIDRRRKIARVETRLSKSAPRMQGRREIRFSWIFDKINIIDGQLILQKKNGLIISSIKYKIFSDAKQIINKITIGITVGRIGEGNVRGDRSEKGWKKSWPIAQPMKVHSRIFRISPGQCRS